MTFDELKRMNIPLWEVFAGGAALVAVVWAAFAWADDIEDKQRITQDQLDQLVVIVSKTSSDNSNTHDVQAEDIERVEVGFELLKQELELRRELENEADEIE